MTVSGTENRVLQAWRVLIAVVREIFDESSYARYLERTDQRSSRAAYAGFLAETEAARARRHRCC